MAVYVFEDTNQAQANQFLGTDFLVFRTSTATANGVVVTPTGDAFQGTTLSFGGNTLNFPGANLSTASTTGNIVFNDNSALVLGASGADNLFALTTGSGGARSNTIYGLAGADTVSGGLGSDNLYGGQGADTIFGGDGNDRLYGNVFGAASSGDGVDSMFGDAGSDYLQGNAGNDVLNGGTGSDRIFGGAGNDTIFGNTTGADVDTGSDSVNGNQGDDTIALGAGNDVGRGGQGSDTVNGDAGNDILYGDLGSDTLTGGAGIDVLFGGTGTDGTGADRFVFAAGDASSANIGAGGALNNLVDVIGDFVDGSDKIVLSNIQGGASTEFVPTTVLTDSSGSQFGTLAALRDFAQSLMDGPGNSDTADNATEIVSLNFNGDTVLFYISAAASTQIDSAIRVIGVGPSVFNVGTGSDFILSV